MIIGTTTIAFCASLTLHAFVALSAIDRYAGERIYLPGFDRTRVAAKSTSERILIPLPIPQPDPRPDEQLGRRDGSGTAVDDSPGELPLVARKGPQNQAFLSRDPPGPGLLRSELSESVLPSGRAALSTSLQARDADRQPQSRQEAVEESIEAQRSIPFGIGEPDARLGDSDVDRPAVTARPAVEAAAVIAQQPTNAAAASAPPPIGEPGAPNSPADPAPQSDTESDPFTVLGGANFSPGGTKAQLGRAHRLTYPRIGLSGLVDGAQIGRAMLVLQITIDQSGNVNSASVFKSSGSNSIDQACRTTAYEWWFEPLKGKDGRVRRSETFLFLITFS